MVYSVNLKVGKVVDNGPFVDVTSSGVLYHGVEEMQRLHSVEIRMTYKDKEIKGVTSLYAIPQGEIIRVNAEGKGDSPRQALEELVKRCNPNFVRV